jgi:hypothetical protein
MALWSTYDEVGVKEDVSDVISNISPTKTPFQSSIGSEKCSQKLFEWQEDSLRAVAENAQVEGFTASDVTLTATTMRSNLTQIMSETIKVAATPDASDAYGRAKESAYQLSKSMAQVKRDLEHAYVGSAQAKVTPASNLTARKMAGFQAQLLNGGTGSLDSDDFVIYTGGTSTVPDEDDLLPLLQHLYDNGSDPTTIMVTSANSRTVANFMKASGSARERDFGASKTLVNVVDVYVSPFGQQKVVLNRFLKSKNTLVYDPDMWKKVTLRPWTRETLAKTGDNTSIMIVGEFSLKHKNFKASAAIVEAAGPTGF